MRFLPRDYTIQENLIAEELSTLGLRYDQQVEVYPYTVDFFVPELGMIIEADGVYGHLRKRDVQRDGDLCVCMELKMFCILQTAPKKE